MKKINFGIIGGGLMGREFASAAARWSHLAGMRVQPQITAVCDSNPVVLDWYRQNFSSLKLLTTNYRELLGDAAVDAVYCAVPHHLHEEIYLAVIGAGKHLMGEKPFGINLAANNAILSVLRAAPHVFARCSSEFPFYPAAQRIGTMIEQGAFGRIIEVDSFFLHSSDLDPQKPINWKRKIEFNGEYGCMGDLGMHVCHIPFRAKWFPRNVRAILSDIVAERPDAHGVRVPCRTWDNATLLCAAGDPGYGTIFPLTFKMQRIAPGEKNTWGITILGDRGGARFSTKNPRRLEILEYSGGEQNWQQIDMGHEMAFASVTGAIFEAGFSDVVLQMWAAFMFELSEKRPLNKFAACVTPEETHWSHRLFTAALDSHAQDRVTAL